MMKRNGPHYNTLSIPVHDAGFMLLEVMASVAILGLAVIAVIQLFAGGLRLARVSDDYTEMVLLAQERMGEALLNEPLEEGRTSGTSGGGARWTVDVSGYEAYGVKRADVAAYKIYSVAVRVVGQGDSGRDFKLTTLKTVVQ